MNNEYKLIVENVIETGQVSATYIQKKFDKSYEESKAIIDKMEEEKIISEYQGNVPRKVLITREEWDKLNNNKIHINLNNN